jgi:hypothetical protein
VAMATVPSATPVHTPPAKSWPLVWQLDIINPVMGRRVLKVMDVFINWLISDFESNFKKNHARKRNAAIKKQN